jgi:hypothetical protein
MDVSEMHVLRMHPRSGPQGWTRWGAHGFFQVYNMQPSRCICGRCGFVEECFDVPEHLEAVRRKYGEPLPLN